MTIPAATLYAWSRLLATCASYFDDVASEAAADRPDDEASDALSTEYAAETAQSKKAKAVESRTVASN